MGGSVKRKKLTSDDLMRRLEDPGRQVKRPRLDSGSVGEEEDFISKEIQDSNGEGNDNDDDDDETLEPQEILPRKSLSPASSESFELDTNAKSLYQDVRHQALAGFKLAQSALSRLEVSSHTPVNPRKADKPTAAKENVDFSSLGLSDTFVHSMNSMSIRRPTPVQTACIPPLLEGQ